MNDKRKPILPKEPPKRNIKRIKKILISLMMRLLWYIRYSQCRACTQKPTYSLTVPTLVYIHFYINIRFFLVYQRKYGYIKHQHTKITIAFSAFGIWDGFWGIEIISKQMIQKMSWTLQFTEMIFFTDDLLMEFACSQLYTDYY